MRFRLVKPDPSLFLMEELEGLIERDGKKERRDARRPPQAEDKDVKKRPLPHPETEDPR